jgi:hypothetical protein
MAMLAETDDTLAEIPVIDAPDGPLQLARIEAARLSRLLGLTQRTIPPRLLRWGDAYAVRCLRDAGNPYIDEIDEVARLLGEPGAHALNFSFEMGCTTACRSPDGVAGMRLYRTLDWPFQVGREIVVARHAPPGGRYFNVTWPGYLGVLTAVAPGRFAAAINQPPMAYTFDRFGLGVAIDWVVNRWRIRGATALPPVHLLRQVFEQCTSYADAKVMLATTPICIPVVYTLTGTTPDEGCVIERLESDAVVHEGPVCVSNHWLNDRFRGRECRGRNSRPRLAAMRSAMRALSGGGRFGWLAPPVLNRFTRLAAELDAGGGGLVVQGWHGSTPQTLVLELPPP